MRFFSVATIAALAVSVIASPVASPGGNVAQIIGGGAAYVPPVISYPKPAYPGGGYPGGGNGGAYPGGGNGGAGNGGNNGGNGGNNNGGNGGNNNGGSGGNNNGGSNGQVGNPENCGLSPGQKSALTPLVEELKLTRTVDDLKHLTKQITDLLANTLQEDAVSSILNVVDSLVGGLGLGGLDLKPAVDSVTSILRKQVPCLLDTLLPKP
ncbi:hypothetical protein GGF46_004235 [Coemansia sp. RSA 552]|nr:hypothetical protein GGF46_004235 [Coemansia sp. RSA 552]